MKDLHYYLQLEYPIRIEPDPEGGYVASIPDLPGCYSAGETKQEAAERLEESRAAWIEAYYATHGEAPEPARFSSLSGRILLRLPKYLHRKLHNTAHAEGISVNQYAISLLAEGITLADSARRSQGLPGPETTGTLGRKNRKIRIYENPCSEESSHLLDQPNCGELKSRGLRIRESSKPRTARIRRPGRK
jgi:predicted RNase H-like HicB family nuclease